MAQPYEIIPKKSGNIRVKCLIYTGPSNKPLSTYDSGEIVILKIVKLLKELEAKKTS